MTPMLFVVVLSLVSLAAGGLMLFCAARALGNVEIEDGRGVE